MVLSAQSMLKGYKEDNLNNQVTSVQEAVKKRDSWKGAAIQKGPEHRC
jgi:hypothetical protein